LTLFKASPADISRESITDENHKIRDRRSLRAVGNDIGGSLDIVKVGRRSDAPIQQLAGTTTSDGFSYERRIRYSGPVFAVNPAVVNIGSYGSFRRNLKPLGTTAIARCKPTNHVSDLAVDMSEIYHTGLPSLPGRRLWEQRTHAARSAGHEYLNSEFGWKPLVSDINNACYAAANADRLMKAYEANSGKPVRRSYRFPVEETVTSTDLGPYEGYVTFDPNMVWGFVDATMPMPRLVKTTKFRRETWFSGCFTYHLPTDYISRSRLGKAALEAGHLYGIELTPDVVWKASPWTWAIDWFSNAGDVVSNLSSWATDGLVMRYGYIMEKISYEETYALDRPCRLKSWLGGHAYASPVTVYYESKQRVRATPFGFEISWNGMSPRQLAISAALGLTRWF
jgi:hypothetical protein